MFFLSLALVGAIFATSCARSAPQHKGVLESSQFPADPEPELDASSGNVFLPDKGFDQLNTGETDVELERLRTENNSLKEENFWLRTRLTSLQQSLAEANQTIYSLNKKLDAIFKPNSVGE